MIELTLAVMLVNICATLVFGAGLVRNWLLAQGRLKPVYILNVIMGIAGALLNFAVVSAVPEMWGVLSFLLLNIWGAAMGVKGLWRLRQEKLAKISYIPGLHR